MNDSTAAPPTGKWHVEVSEELVAVYIVEARTRDQARAAAREAFDHVDCESSEVEVDLCMVATDDEEVDFTTRSEHRNA